jgi:very-short-patch-repair endonuclease
MLLCLPPRFGGYGLALPELNKRIELSPRERVVLGNRYFACDLYWTEKRVAVEYDSAQYHTAQEKQERDAIRRNLLEGHGVRVITATRWQVSDEGQFDKLAWQIARAVGKRLRAPKKEHVAARSALRKIAFDWDVLSPAGNMD